MKKETKKEIVLPAHLQALVNDVKVQERWNKIMEEKEVKHIVKDTTPKGYGPDEE